jgi:vacuolar-type H+-ATPase subunit I/STV1
MADENIQYDVHNYEPVNKYIEDQARLKRSASTWRYAKAITLIMAGLGILAVLLAWAYYLYKKPHRLVSLSEIEKKVLQNEERLIDNERRLPSEKEVQTNTLSNQIQSNINKKDQEILNLKEQLKNNPANQALKEETQKLEEEKKVLQDKLNAQNKIQTNVIHFKTSKSKLGNQNISIVTRLHYDDPRNLTPNKITCYIQFDNKDIPTIELGRENDTSFYFSNNNKKTYSINDQQIINLREKYCLF